MTHNTIYSDNSEHARSKTIRKFITNMRYERNTSAASLSAMLEQYLLPALRSQESGAVPPTSTETPIRREALHEQTWMSSLMSARRSKERHQKLI